MWKSKHNRTVLIQEALKPVPVFKMQNFSCKKKKKRHKKQQFAHKMDVTVTLA